MNVVKRRWPDLLIGLLVLLLLAGFAALLLGRTASTTVTRTPADQSPTTQVPATQAPVTRAPVTQAPRPRAPSASTPDPAPDVQAPDVQANSIPTIPAAPVTSGGAAQPGTAQPDAAQPDAAQPAPDQTTPPVASGATPRAGGAVATSEARTPTRNDYRISLGKFGDRAALQATTAGVGQLGYTVHPIPVVSGVVAQVGPFASREDAAQALADIQRALPGALLYPPRNAPAASSTDTQSTDTQSTGTQSTGTQSTGTQSTGTQSTGTQGTANTPAVSPPASTQPDVAQQPATQQPATPPAASAPEPAPSGPVYLQVGAYNSTTAAQKAVGLVRDMGMEPSVNAPAGKLVTVVVGPFQGQSLINAEAKLQAGGIDTFRVR